MVQCKKDEIRVTANFRGLWHIPFIAKKTQSYCLPAGSSVEYFMNLLLKEFGSEFKTILPFCNPVIAGRLVTPYERKGTKLRDGQWVSFTFGPDGG